MTAVKGTHTLTHTRILLNPGSDSAFGHVADIRCQDGKWLPWKDDYRGTTLSSLTPKANKEGSHRDDSPPRG